MTASSRTVLAATLLAAAASAQFTLVAPTGYANAEGNASNTYPWQRNAAAMRIQFLYDSSHFTGQGASSPILISRLRYRANATTGTWAGGSWPNVQIDMATATSDHAVASTTFAANMGPDLTTVHSGAVTVHAGTGNGTGVPGPWYIDIPLATPFLYDPTTGNDLAIDIQLDGTGWTGTSISADHVSSTGAPPPLASRVYSTTAANATTGTLGANYGAVCEFTYVPANGLYPTFTATPTTGAAPLAVQFSDQSYSSDPGGIVAWLWDVDGDNVVDYTTQNPSHVYASCGTYDVSLSVVADTNIQITLTKTAYVEVDPLTASFTAAVSGGFAPVNVQFTDTSLGATAWLWDFDGDTVIDSAQQNPSWVYTTPGTYSVSLTTINACRQVTTTRNNLITVLAPGQTPAGPELLQYQFNEVRGTEFANTATTNAAPALGTLANTVTNWQSDPGRASFRGNEPGFGSLGYRSTGGGAVNSGWTTAVSGSFSVSFWLRRDPASTSTNPFGYAFGNGTFRSFVAGAAGQGITFRGSAIGNVDSGFTVTGTPGVWQHICLVVDDAAGTATWFSDGVAGNSVTFPANSFAYTSTAPLAVGAISSTGGSSIGTHYDLDDFRFYLRALQPAEVLVESLSAERAAAGAFGSSCAGPGGTPEVQGVGVPSLGNGTFALQLANAESGRLAACAIGFTPATFGTLSLAPWLGAGCELQTDAASLTFHVTGATGATQAFPIPNGAAFAGLHVYAQWLVLGTQGAATRLLDVNLR